MKFLHLNIKTYNGVLNKISFPVVKGFIVRIFKSQIPYFLNVNKITPRRSILYKACMIELMNIRKLNEIYDTFTSKFPFWLILSFITVINYIFQREKPGS